MGGVLDLREVGGFVVKEGILGLVGGVDVWFSAVVLEGTGNEVDFLRSRLDQRLPCMMVAKVGSR